MPQPWPWVKVMERSSSTIPQTHIFFVPNIKGLAQTVLTWEGKVFADADAAETDWKHKVTPERGDLIRAKWNFHRIWIVMEKLLVKWASMCWYKKILCHNAAIFTFRDEALTMSTFAKSTRSHARKQSIVNNIQITKPLENYCNKTFLKI